MEAIQSGPQGTMVVCSLDLKLRHNGRWLEITHKRHPGRDHRWPIDQADWSAFGYHKHTEYTAYVSSGLPRGCWDASGQQKLYVAVRHALYLLADQGSVPQQADPAAHIALQTMHGLRADI